MHRANNWTWAIKHRLNFFADSAMISQFVARNAVRFGNFPDIGKSQLAGRIASDHSSLEIVSLSRHDRSIGAIAQDEVFDGVDSGGGESPIPEC